VNLGQHEAALEQLGRAMRLNPVGPDVSRVEAARSCANLLLGRYREAIASAANALARQPEMMAPLQVSAIANAYTGNLEEARRIMARALQINPAMRIAQIGKFLALRRPEDLAKWAEGLRLAGMPE
jgi:tetratricopeptide (TPR) repeat protein